MILDLAALQKATAQLEDALGITHEASERGDERAVSEVFKAVVERGSAPLLRRAGAEPSGPP